MTGTERIILEALLELERAVAPMPTANPKPNLLPLFSCLDDLPRQLPRETDPSLLHYCTRRTTKRRGIWPVRFGGSSAAISAVPRSPVA